ncbi:hypothetical protein LCGC14_3002150 [marine sediment metagenome]|uniref:Uncharacterized protein n=1 Tax=marine sediment metagenome TaxID=412755 RepID=A0A0F8ZRT7_9ZZZZ
MHKTKPKSEYGYYCDLCNEQICKYTADFPSCGGLYISRSIPISKEVTDHKDFDICQECAREIAQAVLDEY